MRQIALDTETTGLKPELGHRVIEIGCVELIDRRLTGNNFHCYINPEREVEAGALAVHGISNDFLADKPKFADIMDEFMAYIKDAELVIHNAPFDVGFINHEFKLHKIKQRVDEMCTITDSLTMARRKHAGQRNSLDALCSRYEVDNSNRELHGALLDAEILAEVYLRMTGGQVQMFSDKKKRTEHSESVKIERSGETPIVQASPEDVKAHEAYMSWLAEEAA